MAVVWTLIAVALTLSPQLPPQAERNSSVPTLLVEVVDHGWLTIPGITVTVIRRGDLKVRQTVITNVNGIAAFSLPRDVGYDIEAKAVGFKTERVKSVKIGTSLEIPANGALANSKIVDRPAHVQIRLKLSGPTMTVY